MADQLRVTRPLFGLDHASWDHLDPEDCTAGKNDGGEGRENEHHTLHGEKTPFVELVWSSPIPLVMEERCPLRSFQC